MNLDFDSFLSWRMGQQTRGKYLADEALKVAATKFNTCIVLKPVNAASFAHFLRKDVQSKNYTIREKTSRTGFQDGFIAAPSSGFVSRPLQFCIDGRDFFAVVRDEVEMLTTSPMPLDKQIEVGCYADGSYVISDIDVLGIFFKNSSDDAIVNDPEFGVVTLPEKSVIQEVNRFFPFNLIAHGPINHLPNACPIRYPLTVYTPHNTIEQIGDEAHWTWFLGQMNSIRGVL